MKSAETKLPNDTKKLKALLFDKDVLLDKKQARIDLLEEALRFMRHKQFGKSSEKHIDQGELFNEAALSASEQACDQPPSSETSSTQKNKSGGRKPFPKELPRIAVYHALPEDEKANAISTFFDLVKEELDIIPAKIQVLQHFQKKAVYEQSGQRTIKSAPLPKHILPKSMISLRVLAYIVISKYADGLPLHRLEKILQRYGGDISRTNMANWIIRLVEPLQPLLNLFRDQLLEGFSINADETRIQVLKEPDKPPDSQSQMWVQVGGKKGQKVIVFDYDPTRSAKVPLRLLSDYHGYLQTDGYAAYNEVCKQNGITQLGCWDHCRRKFKEAQQSEPKKKASTAPSKAVIALNLIAKLYAVEAQIKSLTAEEKWQQRQERSLPILNQLKEWSEAVSSKVAKGSKTGKALTYMNNQWGKLIRYCDDGRLNISNCSAENAIRPFVVGRKAWLFADTPRGANASAALYSIIETAKTNGLEPYQYLCHIFKELPQANSVEDYERLLPWNVDTEKLVDYGRHA